jgi:hypothetical protein
MVQQPKPIVPNMRDQYPHSRALRRGNSGKRSLEESIQSRKGTNH